jgi:hypothetical protein
VGVDVLSGAVVGVAVGVFVDVAVGVTVSGPNNTKAASPGTSW